LKQVENNNKWKEFTNLKPGPFMTYKSRQYSEKDERKLMKAIIAQTTSYNNEQKRKRQKIQRNQRQKIVRGYRRKRWYVLNNIDLVMAANKKESQEHSNNNYELCVDSNDIAKKVH
jgi:hypothetical protein